MTQALTVSQSLSRWGHELVAVVAGRNSNRRLPAFFEDAFPVPVTSLQSPGFVFRGGRSVDLSATIRRAVTDLPRYRESLRALRRLVRESRPDLIINLFEPLTGLAQLLRPLPAPVLAIAHQFMIPHPSYIRPMYHRATQFGLRLFVNLVGCRSWKLALSLTAAPDWPERRVLVSPPLLREELFTMEPSPGAYVLAYILNPEYAGEIARWQAHHADVAIHCFYDRAGAPEEEEVQPNLTFHRLDGGKFLRLMAGCRALVCTAGFESMCEAAWLGKPVFAVPVENHAEQMLNALDLTRAGFGIADVKFTLDRLRELPPKLDNRRFREWVARGDRILERALAAAVAGGARHRKPVSLAGPRPEATKPLGP